MSKEDNRLKINEIRKKEEYSDDYRKNTIWSTVGAVLDFLAAGGLFTWFYHNHKNQWLEPGNLTQSDVLQVVIFCVFMAFGIYNSKNAIVNWHKSKTR